MDFEITIPFNLSSSEDDKSNTLNLTYSVDEDYFFSNLGYIVFHGFINSLISKVDIISSSYKLSLSSIAVIINFNMIF